MKNARMRLAKGTRRVYLPDAGGRVSPMSLLRAKICAVINALLTLCFLYIYVLVWYTRVFLLNGRRGENS